VGLRILPLVLWIYGLMLRLLPRTFREEYGSAMRVGLGRALRAQHRQRGRLGVLAYAARELADVVRIAWIQSRHLTDAAEERQRMFSGSTQDLRVTIRALRRRPGFAAMTIGILTLGLALNIVLFSMLNAVWKPALPYAYPDGIVVINEAFPQYGWTGVATSLATFHDLQSAIPSIERVAAYMQRRVSLSGSATQARLEAATISSNLWSVLGVQPVIGRGFTDLDDLAGAPPTVMISFGVWQDHFGSAADVVGRAVTIDGISRVIVGVMPVGFRFPEAEQLWLPLGSLLDVPGNTLQDRALRTWEVVGRLRPGASVAQADAEVRALGEQLAGAFPDANGGWALTTIPIARASFQATGAFFGALQVGGLLIVLIMCSNLGNLLLARGEQRRRELAICASLGASRGRLIRLLMFEVSILAVAGLGLALIFADWAIALVPRAIPESIPFYIRFRIDASVVAFAAVLTAATAVIAGLGAAFRATAGAPYPVLSQTSVALAGGGKAGRARAVFLFVQTATAAALLVSTLVVGLGLMRFQRTDLGFNPSDTLLLEVPLPAATYTREDQTRAFTRTVLERIGAVPNVEAAAAVASMPVAAGSGNALMETDGGNELVGADRAPSTFRVITPLYFRATGMRLVRGRTFTAADRFGAEPVVIVNAEAARRIFRTPDPTGRRLLFGRSAAARQWRTVVGVVADTTEQPLDPEIEPRVFVPFEQEPARGLTLAVRTIGRPELLSHPVVRAVRDVDPALATETPISAERRLSNGLWPLRFFSAFAAALSAFGVIVACSGVYGLAHYLTLARTREIALRLALGAGVKRVFFLVARQTGGPILAGLGVGLVISLAVSTTLQHVMVGVPGFDPMATALGMGVLIVAATVAVGIPATRMTRVQPSEALRNG